MMTLGRELDVHGADDLVLELLTGPDPTEGGVAERGQVLIEERDGVRDTYLYSRDRRASLLSAESSTMLVVPNCCADTPSVDCSARHGRP